MRRGISALFVLALLASLALPAVASAAPTNDKFASRQVLGPGFPGGVPIEITGNNFEAGKEAGESFPGPPGPAGHSVWFGWEATADGWVSIGVCESDFPALIGVFNGNQVNELAPAANGNGSEGPDCPYQGRQYTLFATSGTEYAIGVDGNGFHLPESPPPVTEGEFTLRIEETPVPPNDDFENATKIAATFSEQPNGDRVLFANVRGFNWTATIEHGEPEETSTGASVWYSFTAPEDATYNFGLSCCQTAFGLNRHIYTGDAVDKLTLLSAASETGQLQLAAGETVRIRISGPVAEGSEEPTVANFDFNVSAVIPKADAETPNPFETWTAPPPPPDTTAPETAIGKRYLTVGKAKFWFSASEAASFLCRLDKGPFKPCGSPRAYKRLKGGRHAFRVKAVDAAGNVDATPALARFKTAEPGPRSR